ncbi:hypothetical protein [Methylocapsa aurea]|uniref:hypothetical protein n=1 Tax=Methylocapsa aurea TaxID=663610 RepID=UPI003D18B8DC
MAETDNGLAASLEYATALFEASTIDRMARHYCALLDGIARDPDRRIGGWTFCRRTNAIACWWNGTTPRRTIRRTGFCTRCSRRRRRGTRRLSRWSMKARSSPMAS